MAAAGSLHDHADVDGTDADSGGDDLAVVRSAGTGSFEFRAPLRVAVNAELQPGSLVVLDTGRATDALLGQVLSCSVGDGSHGREIIGTGPLLATCRADRWGAVGAAVALEGAAMRPAPAELVAGFLASRLGDVAALPIGSDAVAGDGRPAVLRADGFARHTFLCGQSGSGKTYTTGLLLEQLLLQTELRVVVLDPNSDYVRVGELGDPDADADEARLAELAGRVCVFRDDDAPYRLRVRFGRLPLATRALVLALDPLRDREEFAALRRVSDRLATTEHSLRDLVAALDPDDAWDRALRLRTENLGVLDWSIWAERDQSPVLDQLPTDWRAAIMDLGGVDSAIERNAVAAALLSGLWNARHRREPVLIVIDEAHNVCPQAAVDQYQALAVDAAVNIAAEGRKYGLYLLVATQRPQKVHVNVLSQCENLLLMHVNSSADLEHLAATFAHVPRVLVEQARGFGLGEGLAAGRITTTPVRFRSGRRRSPEGGADIPATWSRRRDVPGPL